MFLFYSWIRGLLTVANPGCPPPLISSKWLEIMGEHLPSIDCADWEREKRRERRGGWRRPRRAVNAIVRGAVVDRGPGSICPCYRDRDWGQTFFCQLNLCGYALPVYVVYLGGGPVRSEALVRPHRMHLPRAGPRSCSKPCQTYPRKDDDGVTTMTTVPEDGSKDPKPIDSLSDNSRFAPLTWSTPFPFQNMMHIVFLSKSKLLKFEWLYTKNINIYNTICIHNMSVSNDTETFLYSHLNFNKVDFDQKLNASYFGKEWVCTLMWIIKILFIAPAFYVRLFPWGHTGGCNKERAKRKCCLFFN
jgi:hypothetical protein